MRKTVFVTLFLAVFVAAVPALAEVTIGRIMVGTDVVDHEPLGVATRFPPDVGGIFCFTHVMGMESGSMTHRWIFKGKVLAEVNLKIGGTSWRTWSRKTIDPLWSGNWKVEIINDTDGQVLSTIEFVVDE